MKSKKLEELKNSKKVKNFIDKANFYCDLIESGENIDKTEFLNAIYRALLDLYAAGVNLPEVELEIDVDFTNELDLSIGKLTSKISNIFKKHETYNFVFDPIYPDIEDPSLGSFGGDLVEIYADIKNQLLIYQKGSDEAIESALWSFKFGLQTHWGMHAIAALRALHFLVYDHGV